MVEKEDFKLKYEYISLEGRMIVKIGKRDKCEDWQKSNCIK